MRGALIVLMSTALCVSGQPAWASQPLNGKGGEPPVLAAEAKTPSATTPAPNAAAPPSVPTPPESQPVPNAEAVAARVYEDCHGAQLKDSDRGGVLMCMGERLSLSCGGDLQCRDAVRGLARREFGM